MMITVYVLIAPVADRLRKVNMQVITQPVPAQDGTTRDAATVRTNGDVPANGSVAPIAAAVAHAVAQR